MTVEELIERLNTIENPKEANIMFRDSAAGNREIDHIEKILDLHYIIHGKRTKRGK